jgi:hypothetical protein
VELFRPDRHHLVAHSRDRPISFEASKETKMLVSKEASFRSGHAAQSRENLGCNLSPQLRSLLAPLRAKFAMPRSRTRPSLFSLLLAEAFLLTGREESFALPSRHCEVRSNLYAISMRFCMSAICMVVSAHSRAGLFVIHFLFVFLSQQGLSQRTLRLQCLDLSCRLNFRFVTCRFAQGPRWETLR